MRYDQIGLTDLEFKYELNYIVAERILYKHQCLHGNLMRQSFLLVFVSCINTLLHYTTAMFVTSDLNTLPHHGVVEKLVLRTVPAVENLLDNVISIDVFGHFFDAVLEIAGN